MHYDIVLIPCAIFICFGFIGYCVVNELASQYNLTRRWLLAPVAGLSVVMLLATLLSRLGLPAKVFGVPMVLSLVLVSALYWIVRRPRIAWIGSAVWAVGFLAVMLLVAWPLLVYGTDWISAGNGDMTIYILGGNHFFEHGFYQLPPLDQFLRETDPSWDHSLFYSMGEVRFGSQLLIACFMAVSGLTAAQGYMILITAIHLVVLSTSVALICTGGPRFRLLFAALLVIGSAANFALGTFLQLMPQDLGLAMLAGACAVLLDRPAEGRLLLRQAIFAGLLVSAMTIVYPEVLSFLAISVVIYVAVELFRRQAEPRRVFAFIGMTGLATLILANANLVGALHYLSAIVVYSSSAEINATLNDLFPFYLTPLGFSAGWGFASVADVIVKTWREQTYIVIGATLYLTALIVSARSLWRLEGVGAISLVLLLFFALLFRGYNGFGLFKLAMYAQPFVLGALLLAVERVFVRTSAVRLTASES